MLELVEEKQQTIEKYQRVKQEEIEQVLQNS